MKTNDSVKNKNKNKTLLGGKAKYMWAESDPWAAILYHLF